MAQTIMDYVRPICHQIGLRRGASRRGRAAYKDVRERASRRATKYQVDLMSKEGWRAVPPALAEVGYGCFLPDLTRFTTMQCGAARRCSLQCERTRALIISANDACAASDVARTTKWRGYASTPAQG